MIVIIITTYIQRMELGSNSIWLNFIFDFADSVWASLKIIDKY